MVKRPELLIQPNIPKPLHGLAPRTILGTEWWDERRRLAYQMNDYHCAACGTHKSQVKGSRKVLEAHECYHYDYAAGSAEMTEIIALCPYCHAFIHSGRQEALLEQGNITREQYQAVRDHGLALLQEAGLKPWQPTDGPIQQDWTKWHVVIGGRKYFSKFTCFEDWFNAYH